MKFRVRFHHYADVRKTPIFSNYHPGWIAPNKPDQNSAALFFDDVKMLMPGETHNCILEPLCPELWTQVENNDILKCMESSRQIGEALVLEIIK